MSFETLTLSVRRGANDQWVVTAMNPHCGKGKATTKLPFSREDFSWELDRLGIIKESKVRPQKGPLADLAPRQMGHRLFECLMKGGVGDCFHRTYQFSRGRLRILIEMDPDPEMKPFFDLPWELICNPEDGMYPALQRDGGIVRQIVNDRPFRLEPLELPLKILVVLPDIKDPKLADLHVDQFKQTLKDTDWDGRVKLDFLEHPTLRNLGKQVLHPYHAIHFSMHGGWLGKEWGVALIKDQGGWDKVSAEELAITLEPARKHLRLVTLMSCNSGRVGEKQVFDPFQGVATTLLKSGIPAVIATNFSISVEALHTFCEGFYEQIAAGRNLMVAANEGRRAIKQKDRCDEWLVPVLYSSLEDDRLFGPTPRLYVNNFERRIDHAKLIKRNPRTVFLDVYPYFEDARTADWDAILKKIWPLQSLFDEREPIVMEGNARLSIWVALGYVFSQPSGFKLFFTQLNHRTGLREQWGTLTRNGKRKQWKLDSVPGKGKPEEIVVSIAISRKVEDQVSKYINENLAGEYGQWLKFTIAGGPSRNSLEKGQDAVKMAEEIAGELRKQKQGLAKVHLFLATPSGFALILGHYLNACGKIVVYEHQDPDYAPTFTLGKDW